MLDSGRIVLPGTPNLAGSGSHLKECVEWVVRLGQVAHADAWTMASVNPARLMGFDEKLGIAQGAEATLAVYQLGSDGVSIDVQQTWVAGRLVFDQTRDARVSMPDAPLDVAHPI